MEEEFDADVAVGADRVRDFFFVKVLRNAVLVEEVAVDLERDCRGVVRDSAASGRGDDASPVRVGAADRGLDERVVRDGLREELRGRAVRRAG